MDEPASAAVQVVMATHRLIGQTDPQGLLGIDDATGQAQLGSDARANQTG